MFKNKLGALVFVVLTMFGAASLIGSEDEEGTLLQATSEIEQQRSDFQIASEKLAGSNARSDDDGSDYFTDDEELIDEAEGFDPSPDTDEPFDTAPETGEEVYIIEDQPITGEE